MINFILLFVLILSFSGCASVQEFSKTIWGSSTRVLEEKRIDAITKVYDKDYWRFTFNGATKLVEPYFKILEQMMVSNKYVFFIAEKK